MLCSKQPIAKVMGRDNNIDPHPCTGSGPPLNGFQLTAIFKNVNCDISATVWPKLIKFSTSVVHTGPPAWMATKNVKFWKYKLTPIGRHPENRKKCDIFITGWQILMKFCTLTALRIMAAKNSNYKNQAPFWKPLNASILQPLDRFWWNLVCWCILTLLIR